MSIQKIVSGGQTGVDRAALDAARAAGVPTGGWCPRGRRAEDGAIDARYPLQETPSSEYAQRTTWNVRDSDGTVVLHAGQIEGGTAFTIAVARERGKPLLQANITNADPTPVRAWLRTHAIDVLNVAGPRESEAPGIYTAARSFLDPLLATIAPTA